MIVHKVCTCCMHLYYCSILVNRFNWSTDGQASQSSSLVHIGDIATSVHMVTRLYQQASLEEVTEVASALCLLRIPNCSQNRLIFRFYLFHLYMGKIICLLDLVV